MQKRTKIGVFALSALALAMSGSAQAALTGTAIVGTMSFTGPAVVYDNAAGGNNAASAAMGGAAGPFAPASSINITNSRHNLGSGNTLDSNHTAYVLKTNVSGAANQVVGTNQICVFCHTPHGFNTVQSGPLWNKKVGVASSYTVYNAGSNNSDTLDANVPVIGSVSLACLSCHDGTQAMDNMINAPGSGGMANGFDATLTSAQAAGANNGVSQGYIWGTPVGSNGFALMSQGGSNGVAAIAPNADGPAKEGIDLGTDLSNDHPISVQYCGGGITVAGNTGASAIGGTVGYAAGTCNDRLFNLPTVATVNGAPRFWVDTNVIPDADAIAAGAASIGGATANPITRDPTTLEIYVGTGTTQATGVGGDVSGRGFISKTVANATIPGFGVRTKQDIMLFTNNAGVSGPSVECASCHDPHTPNNGTFLRVSNNGSGLCLSCHVK